MLFLHEEVTLSLLLRVPWLLTLGFLNSLLLVHSAHHELDLSWSNCGRVLRRLQEERIVFSVLGHGLEGDLGVESAELGHLLVVEGLHRSHSLIGSRFPR